MVTPQAEQAAATQLMEQAKEHLANPASEALQGQLQQSHPAQIAEMLTGLPSEDRQKVVEALPSEAIPSVLAEMQTAVRNSLLANLDVGVLTETVCVLPEPYAAKLLESLPNNVADEIRETLDPKARERIDATLEWPKGTAGRLMHVDAVSVRAHVTIAAAQRYLRFRKTAPHNSDGLMVVDRANRYLGKVTYAALLTNPPEATIESILDPRAVAVQASLSEEETARLFEQRDLFSVAVVNADGALIGRIAVDDVVDVIRRLADQRMLNLSGMTREDDTFGPVLPSARKRAIWLGINLMTAFLASSVIGLFEHTLDKIVALAVLMPIVSSMGGITGSQTLALVIRGLSIGSITSLNARRLARKELAVGGLNGVLWALMVALVTMLWFGDFRLGLIIAAALVLNMTVAALAGWGLPLLLTKLGQDPAIAGSVLLTTVTDVVGFFAFLGLATVVLL
ncbi:putative magnesium transporter [Magnetofaba australis IT-1]|uniref:Magnesium transporter MgtE n=1 Tax=Magnetofaba australis IT-1 TaxID=1434232 RepID=A0A1Y2K8J3_9PROT|nr:putative magnesium transporter [Magnetofaba australis IT-1]